MLPEMTRSQFKTEFPDRLRRCRQRLKFTQAQLAEATGLTQDWISHFECGRRMPDGYSMVRLFIVFGVEII